MTATDRMGSAPESAPPRPPVAPFSGSHHRWSIDRVARTFVVRVIEPTRYAPSGHSEIFNAVLTELINPAPEAIDPLFPDADRMSSDPFDLITFPEAFVPADTFVAAARLIGGLPAGGCIHVGLRPSDDPMQHLFTVPELLELVGQLLALPTTLDEDFDGFRAWLGRHPALAARQFTMGVARESCSL